MRLCAMFVYEHEWETCGNVEISNIFTVKWERLLFHPLSFSHQTQMGIHQTATVNASNESRKHQEATSSRL